MMFLLGVLQALDCREHMDQANTLVMQGPGHLRQEEVNSVWRFNRRRTQVVALTSLLEEQQWTLDKMLSALNLIDNKELMFSQ
jgi:hypothetical protein